MKREIRPGEYEGILEKLRDAAPPEDLFNEVLKAYNNFRVTVHVEEEKWKEVTTLLIAGVYPLGDLGRFKKVNYDFCEQLGYKNKGVVNVCFPSALYEYSFDRYYVEVRQKSSFDFSTVVDKEQTRRYWITELEKSDAIGITTPLTGEQYTCLSDCCTSISVEYMEGALEEVKGIPDITPELVLEYVEDCYAKIYLPHKEHTEDHTQEVEEKQPWFRKLF